ncbi:MAG TPA: hypothetical protein VGH19_06570 [Verrucomicrobiae bacterium]
MKKYVLYHKGCMDGFGAALCAWLKFGDEATYIPCSNDDKVLPEMEDGSEVYILDFSFSRQVLLDLAFRMKSLLVLDHHKTAREALQGLDFAWFSKENSGAVMAWRHFHKYHPIPLLIQYIEDRDLWAWKLPNSRGVNAVLGTYPMEFPVWHSLLTGMHFSSRKLEGEGEVAWRMIEQAVKRQCGQSSVHVARFAPGEKKIELMAVTPACPSLVAKSFGIHFVPVVNATAYVDEVAEELIRQYEWAPFVGVYQQRANGKTKWSLRSREGFDCLPIAEAFGGGGHERACGFIA